MVTLKQNYKEMEEPLELSPATQDVIEEMIKSLRDYIVVENKMINSLLIDEEYEEAAIIRDEITYNIEYTSALLALHTEEPKEEFITTFTNFSNQTLERILKLKKTVK